MTWEGSLSVGDLIIARIVSFDRTRDPMLTVQDKDLGKIPYGEFIKISPTRVPRLIGKRGSMIQTIEQATLTRVIIGQNGIVVVTGRDIDGLSLAVKAIKMVEEESHTNNLTQKVKTLLNVQDPVELEKSENINISSGDGIDPTPSQASNFQSNSSSGLPSGVDSATGEQQQQPQQPTTEPSNSNSQPQSRSNSRTTANHGAGATASTTANHGAGATATTANHGAGATATTANHGAGATATTAQPRSRSNSHNSTNHGAGATATTAPTTEPEQQPQQQNSSNEDPANASIIDEGQSENQLSNNLTNTEQKEKKHDLISEEDA